MMKKLQSSLSTAARGTNFESSNTASHDVDRSAVSLAAESTSKHVGNHGTSPNATKRSCGALDVASSASPLRQTSSFSGSLVSDALPAGKSDSISHNGEAIIGGQSLVRASLDPLQARARARARNAEESLKNLQSRDAVEQAVAEELRELIMAKAEVSAFLQEQLDGQSDLLVSRTAQAQEIKSGISIALSAVEASSSCVKAESRPSSAAESSVDELLARLLDMKTRLVTAGDGYHCQVQARAAEHKIETHSESAADMRPSRYPETVILAKSTPVQIEGDSIEKTCSVSMSSSTRRHVVPTLQVSSIGTPGSSFTEEPSVPVLVGGGLKKARSDLANMQSNPRNADRIPNESTPCASIPCAGAGVLEHEAGQPSQPEARKHTDRACSLAGAPVVLHIYDVSIDPRIKKFNDFAIQVGTGAFHAGVEVYGAEWSYGGKDLAGASGVFSNLPKQNDQHIYREPLLMGYTQMSHSEVAILIQKLSSQWIGTHYDLLVHNCCHFSDALCRALGVGPAPHWVTHLAAASVTVLSGIVVAREERDRLLNVAALGAQQAAEVAMSKADEIDKQYKIADKVDSLATKEFEIDDTFIESKVNHFWTRALEHAEQVGEYAERAFDEFNVPVSEEPVEERAWQLWSNAARQVEGTFEQVNSWAEKAIDEVRRPSVRLSGTEGGGASLLSAVAELWGQTAVPGSSTPELRSANDVEQNASRPSVRQLAFPGAQPGYFSGNSEFSEESDIGSEPDASSQPRVRRGVPTKFAFGESICSKVKAELHEGDRSLPGPALSLSASTGRCLRAKTSASPSVSSVMNTARDACSDNSRGQRMQVLSNNWPQMPRGDAPLPEPDRSEVPLEDDVEPLWPEDDLFISVQRENIVESQQYAKEPAVPCDLSTTTASVGCMGSAGSDTSTELVRCTGSAGSGATGASAPQVPQKDAHNGSTVAVVTNRESARCGHGLPVEAVAVEGMRPSTRTSEWRRRQSSSNSDVACAAVVDSGLPKGNASDEMSNPGMEGTVTKPPEAVRGHSCHGIVGPSSLSLVAGERLVLAVALSSSEVPSWRASRFSPRGKLCQHVL